MEQLIYSPQSLGKAIQRQRKLMRLNQKEAGQPFNLTQSMVSNIEKGLPGVRIDTIFRILAALELEMVIRSKNEIKELHDEDW